MVLLSVRVWLSISCQRPTDVKSVADGSALLLSKMKVPDISGQVRLAATDILRVSAELKLNGLLGFTDISVRP